MELNMKSGNALAECVLYVAARRCSIRSIHCATVGFKVAHCVDLIGVLHTESILFTDHFQCPTWPSTALHDMAVLYYMRATCSTKGCQYLMFVSCTSSLSKSADSMSLLSEKANPE